MPVRNFASFAWVLIACFMLSGCAGIPWDLAWARTWGGQLVDQGFDLASDSNGNVYVIGGVESTADFDPGSAVNQGNPSIVGTGAFLSKFTARGDFQWVVTWPASKGAVGHGVEIDLSDNIVVTGLFEGDIDLDPGQGTDIHNSTGGWLGVFLCSLNTNGEYQWGDTWVKRPLPGPSGILVIPQDEQSGDPEENGNGETDPTDTDDTGSITDRENSTSSDIRPRHKFRRSKKVWGIPFWYEGPDVGIDGNGNVYIAGRLEGVVEYDPSPDLHITSEEGNGFVMKFDFHGHFQWIRISETRLDAIAVDDSGNAYAAGGGLKKYNTNGDLEWDCKWAQRAFAVAVDNSGNAIAAGEFGYTADFDLGPGEEIHTAEGRKDAYLIKFDPDGELVWVRTWGTRRTDDCRGLSVTDDDNICAVGYSYAGTGGGDHNFFALSFDRNGDLLWAGSHKTQGSINAKAVITVSNTEFYITGYFRERYPSGSGSTSGGVDFDPGQWTDYHTSVGSEDAFLLKLTPDAGR